MAPSANGAQGTTIIRRTLPPILLALSLLVPAVASSATSEVTEISNATANEASFMKAFDAPATAVADFNDDGVPEIVAHNDNQYVYVLSTTSPTILAEFRTPYPPGWNVRPINDPKVADVDDDGNLDIVLVNSAAYVCVYEYDPAGSTSSRFSFVKRWCDRMDAFDGGTAAADAGAAVADVDGDGKLEIFSQTEKRGLYAFNHDGTVRWKKDTWGGNSGPLVTDLNGDGKKEVLFFGDGGEVRNYDASTGASRWSFWAGKYVKPASIPVAGNAADLDGDGKKEVVFVARDAHDEVDYKNNHFMLFVLSSSGGLKWRAQPSWGNPMSYTHPVLVDLDGDGRRDILLQDWNTIGHKPGDWERLGKANVFAYSGSGTLLWRTALDNSWSNDDLALADVDGDGRMEVLAIGGSSGKDGIWYLDARTGAREAHVAVGDWTVLRGPVAGDLDGSGKTSWAVPLHRTANGGAFKVYRTDAPCKVAFGGWSNDFGCGDGSDDDGSTPPPPPPPTGDFDADFSSASGNEWWVQVRVEANRALAGVDARVDGGSWKPLSLKSWGAWAASIHAPEGSVVEFRARASTGETETSGGYRWTAGTPTSGGSTPPPAGFTATFSGVSGNEWWVQANVKVSGGTLAGVDARVDGGAWTALSLKSWGAWAKSIHAPDGSTVEFRARAADGQTATSSAYRWPPG